MTYCPFCGAPFSNEEGLCDHVAHHHFVIHKEEVGLFLCWCGEWWLPGLFQNHCAAYGGLVRHFMDHHVGGGG